MLALPAKNTSPIGHKVKNILITITTMLCLTGPLRAGEGYSSDAPSPRVAICPRKESYEGIALLTLGSSTAIFAGILLTLIEHREGCGTNLLCSIAQNPTATGMTAACLLCLLYGCRAACTSN